MIFKDAQTLENIYSGITKTVAPSEDQLNVVAPLRTNFNDTKTRESLQDAYSLVSEGRREDEEDAAEAHYEGEQEEQKLGLDKEVDGLDRLEGDKGLFRVWYFDDANKGWMWDGDPTDEFNARKIQREYAAKNKKSQILPVDNSAGIPQPLSRHAQLRQGELKTESTKITFQSLYKQILAEDEAPKLSNCCGARELGETGLCSKCKEHAEFEPEKDEELEESLKQTLVKGLKINPKAQYVVTWKSGKEKTLKGESVLGLDKSDVKSIEKA